VAHDRGKAVGNVETGGWEKGMEDCMPEPDQETGKGRPADSSRPAPGELGPVTTVPTDKRRTRRRIRHRTAQLPAASRILYRIEHYSSMAGALGALIVVGAAFGFRTGWVVGFEVSTSSVTLLMVFVIQHTQGREQAATSGSSTSCSGPRPGPPSRS
jgi:hypothetical protein